MGDPYLPALSGLSQWNLLVGGIGSGYYCAMSVQLLIVSCLCSSRWFSQQVQVSINDVSFVVENTYLEGE